MPVRTFSASMRLPIAETAKRTEEVYRAVLDIEPNTILIAHGEAMETPADAQYSHFKGSVRYTRRMRRAELLLRAARFCGESGVRAELAGYPSERTIAG